MVLSIVLSEINKEVVKLNTLRDIRLKRAIQTHGSSSRGNVRRNSV